MNDDNITIQNKDILDPTTIPKYINQLTILPVFNPSICRDPKTNKIYYNYVVDACEFTQQILPPPFNKTTVFGFGGMCRRTPDSRPEYIRSFPGPTFETIKNIPVHVTWNNQISGSYSVPVDPTIMWANPLNITNDMLPTNFPDFPPGFYKAQWPVPMVIHLHGGSTPSKYDGHPFAWFTHNGFRGPVYTTSEYIYNNEQQSTMLWYHDHTLGLTRLNVFSGLAGAYMIKDNFCSYTTGNTGLPSGKYEIPLLIADRTFYTDGSAYYPPVGTSPENHPYWNEAAVGNTMVVNGKVWPNLNVDSQKYRFKLLNMSNGTTFTFALSNNQNFVQITTDGGYREHPLTTNKITLAPAERADIVVDFSNLSIGTKIILLNTDPSALPSTNEVMQFTVTKKGTKKYSVPQTLNKIPKFIADSEPINRTLFELGDNLGRPIALFLDGQSFANPPSEFVQVGSTVPFNFINLTADMHPMHLHLVQFQIIGYQPFDVDAYRADWLALNGTPPFNGPTKELDVTNYITGPITPPLETDVGLKDTVKAIPGNITRILVRFAPDSLPNSKVTPGVNSYSFDPTEGPGYLWHCHIVEHEDNEMMRPFFVVNNKVNNQ